MQETANSLTIINVAPIIISVLSLFGSIYVLWVTRLSRFKLDVRSTARVELSKNPQSPGATAPGVLLDLLFTNKGARIGYVVDVAIAIRAENQKQVLFRSLFERHANELNLTAQLPPPKLSAFSSFPVKMGETIEKQIFFVPFSPDSDFVFEQGKYGLIPLTLEDGQDHWRRWPAAEIDISQDDIEIVDRTTAVQTNADGGQFVQWICHNKPVAKVEKALASLAEELGV